MPVTRWDFALLYPSGVTTGVSVAMTYDNESATFRNMLTAARQCKHEGDVNTSI